MATYSDNVGNTTGDDAFEPSTSSAVNLTQTSFNVDGDDEWGIDIWRGLGLMDGGTVISAVAQYKVTDGSNDEPDVTFYGVNEDNTPAATTAQQDISSRPRTSASVAWDNPNLGASGATFFSAPSFVSLLQEVIDDGHIVLGVFGVVYTSTNGAGARDFTRLTQDSASGDSAILDVEYTPASTTWTGSAAVTIGGATCAGVADFNPPVYAATAAVSIGGATCEASATFAPGTDTGSAAVTVGAVVSAAAGEFSAPIYSATADVETGAATCAATAQLAAGIEGSADVTIGGATCAATADFNPPVYSGSAAVTTGGVTCSAAATYTPSGLQRRIQQEGLFVGSCAL